jgi:hypothetical protein
LKELNGTELTVDEFLEELKRDAARHYYEMIEVMEKTNEVLVKAL